MSRRPRRSGQKLFEAAKRAARPVESDVRAARYLRVGALIMLGTLFGLIALIYALVLRYDPDARGK